MYRDIYIGLFFFFSSRRRHTRYIGDWSSDVCSSDLIADVDAERCARARERADEADLHLVGRLSRQREPCRGDPNECKQVPGHDRRLLTLVRTQTICAGQPEVKLPGSSRTRRCSVTKRTGRPKMLQDTLGLIYSRSKHLCFASPRSNLPAGPGRAAPTAKRARGPATTAPCASGCVCSPARSCSSGTCATSCDCASGRRCRAST